MLKSIRNEQTVITPVWALLVLWEFYTVLDLTYQPLEACAETGNLLPLLLQ